VDERLDPMASTRAAARLLKENYRVLGSWPLAITAYNHGTSGMRRAVRRLGTDDMGVIARKYRSRRFGFASRNFYAQFLAARRILRAYEPYFGPLVRDVPQAVDEVTLPFYADVKDLQAHTGVAPEVIKHYNPTLRPPVYRAVKRIPKGYVLRLPAGTLGSDPQKWLESIPEGKRHAKQRRSNYYQVRRGDTLSEIARRHGTSVSTLVAFNNLPSRHRIFPGQVLQMPEPGQSVKRRRGLVKTARAATPRPRPASPAQPLPVAEDRITPLSGPTPEISSESPWRRVDGNRIIVDALETLGHFAEWLEIPTQRLRDLNGIAYGRDLHMGERLELDFSRVTPQRFLERRMEYHKGIEEDFFGSYEVTGTISHRLRRGETIWELSYKTYGVPSWLIRRYNADVDLTKLVPGDALLIPVVKRLGSS
jgi:membrane-bound lytic murein transglycosylase D